jgi:hypothetical protein
VNSVEDRLRAAVHAYVPDDSAPPLELNPQHTPPARRPGRDGAGGGRPWRRTRGWAVPLAAAAAVVAVVAASLVITRGMSGPAANHPAAPTLSSTPPPPYYVASWISNGSGNQHGIVQVRATATGALQANVPLPRPYAFVPTVMAAAGNDRVFLLLAIDPTGGQRFFLLRFTPGSQGGVTRLTPLELTLANGDVFALSPGGTMLAAASRAAHGRPGTLTVYNLVTGAKRTWTGWAAPAGSAYSALAWSADGRWLQFCWGFGGADQPVRFGRLNPSAPGTTLPAPTASVVAPARTVGLTFLTDGNLAVIVSSGKRLLVEILSEHGSAPVVIPLPDRGQSARARLEPMWYSDTGETMILEDDTTPMKIGVFSAGRYRPLPLDSPFQQAGNTILEW